MMVSITSRDKQVILPRFIRLRSAPAYLDMDKNLFNKMVRPTVTEIPIGNHGIAFDRLDLDAWADQYKNSNGRPKHEATTWDAKERQGSDSGRASGILKSKSVESRFAKALERAISKKRN